MNRYAQPTIVEVLVTDVPEGDGTSVGLAHGRALRTGQPMTFAGEPRMLRDLRQALAEGETICVALIEPWQIISHN